MGKKNPRFLGKKKEFVGFCFLCSDQIFKGAGLVSPLSGRIYCLECGQYLPVDKKDMKVI